MPRHRPAPPQKNVNHAAEARRRVSGARVALALAAARKAGMPVASLKIALDGEIDIRFGKPVPPAADRESHQ